MIFKRLMTNPNVPPPISNAHTECLIGVVELLASEQLCLPRLFYQSLQTTNIKLAVTPQPRNPNEPITVPSSQQIAVKVEGVITAAASAGRQTFRNIDSIKLTLTTALQTPAKQQNDLAKTMADCNQSLDQLVVPHNDFFSAQFLVPFPVAGTYLAVIDSRLIDNDERTWRQSGLNTVLNIKAFEDGQTRMQGNRRQQ